MTNATASSPPSESRILAEYWNYLECGNLPLLWHRAGGEGAKLSGERKKKKQIFSLVR
jgi:hypothetical protein